MKSNISKSVATMSLAAMAAIFAADCAAAVQGYERSETSAYNGHAGASLIKYSKGNAKAYLFRFDLSKGFRIRIWLGESNLNLGPFFFDCFCSSARKSEHTFTHSSQMQTPVALDNILPTSSSLRPQNAQY